MFHKMLILDQVCCISVCSWPYYTSQPFIVINVISIAVPAAQSALQQQHDKQQVMTS